MKKITSWSFNSQKNRVSLNSFLIVFWFFISLAVVCSGEVFSQSIETKRTYLERLIQASVEKAYGLQISKLQSEKVENNRWSAWANLLPRVGLSAGRGYTQSATTSGGEITTTVSRSDALSVSAEWQIWDGFRSIRDVKLAHLDLNIQRIQSDLDLQNYIVELLDQYLGLQALYTKRSTLRETIKNARSFAEEAAELVKLGGKTRMDLMDTEIQLRNFENDARELENAVLLAERNFSILLNTEEPLKFQEEEVSSSAPYFMARFEKVLPKIRSKVQEELSLYSPELRISNLRLEKAVQENAQTTLGYIPNTSLRFSHDWDFSPHLRDGVDEVDRVVLPTSSITFQLSWPVWDWLSTHRRIVNSGKDVKIEQLDLKRKVRTVGTDFRFQLEQYDALVKNIEISRLVVKQAEEQIAYTLAMYQLGRIALLQAQTASERLSTSRNALIARLRSQYVAAAKLLVQSGESLLPEGVSSPLLFQRAP